MKLSDMFKPVPNAPELTKEEAQENLRQWSSKNHPATRGETLIVVLGVLSFFVLASHMDVITSKFPPIPNVQIETPRGPNAEETAALKSKMAKYHQPKALFNLLVNGQE